MQTPSSSKLTGEYFAFSKVNANPHQHHPEDTWESDVLKEIIAIDNSADANAIIHSQPKSNPAPVTILLTGGNTLAAQRAVTCQVQAKPGLVNIKNVIAGAPFGEELMNGRLEDDEVQEIAKELGLGGTKEEEKSLLEKKTNSPDIQYLYETLSQPDASNTVFYNLCAPQLAILYATKLRDPEAKIDSIPIPTKEQLKAGAKMPKQPKPAFAPLATKNVWQFFPFHKIVWNGSPNSIRRIKQALQCLPICGGDEGRAEVLYHEFHDYVLMKGLFGRVWIYEQGSVEGNKQDKEGKRVKFYFGKANSKLYPLFCKALAAQVIDGERQIKLSSHINAARGKIASKLETRGKLPQFTAEQKQHVQDRLNLAIQTFAAGDWEGKDDMLVALSKETDIPMFQLDRAIWACSAQDFDLPVSQLCAYIEGQQVCMVGANQALVRTASTSIGSGPGADRYILAESISTIICHCLLVRDGRTVGTYTSDGSANGGLKAPIRSAEALFKAELDIATRRLQEHLLQ